jgi:putative aldouronate transport system permease protein
VILPGLVSVFNFVIMRTHFESIPDALEESAKIDGANQWQIFWRIYMPVSATSLAVMTLFYGVSHWNGWMNAMLYLPNSRELFPLALITREIVLSSATSAMNDGAALTQEMADAIKYATIIVSTLPILCLYPFLQKYFTKGVMVGSVKG